MFVSQDRSQIYLPLVNLDVPPPELSLHLHADAWGVAVARE
jgi:hypothetical protein